MALAYNTFSLPVEHLSSRSTTIPILISLFRLWSSSIFLFLRLSLLFYNLISLRRWSSSSFHSYDCRHCSTFSSALDFSRLFACHCNSVPSSESLSTTPSLARMRPSTIVTIVFATLVSQGNIAAALPVSYQQSGSNGRLGGESGASELKTLVLATAFETRDVAADLGARHAVGQAKSAPPDVDERGLFERATWTDYLTYALAARIAIKKVGGIVVFHLNDVSQTRPYRTSKDLSTHNLVKDQKEKIHNLQVPLWKEWYRRVNQYRNFLKLPPLPDAIIKAKTELYAKQGVEVTETTIGMAAGAPN